MKLWLYYFYYSLKYLYYSIIGKQFEKGDLLTMKNEIYEYIKRVSDYLDSIEESY